MGWVIFLAIVAAIIVLIVMRKKRKKAEKEAQEAAAIEDLKISKAYELAIKIKDELEKKKGYKFREVKWEYYKTAYGVFSCPLPALSDGEYFTIDFSIYLTGGLDVSRYSVQTKRYHSIENDNVGIVVYTTEATQDVPESIKITAKVIEDSGFGQCKKIQ